VSFEVDMFERFVKKIRARFLYQNKNWLAIICGETGSGKSYSALTIAGLIGNKTHIVFTPIEFLQLLNSKSLSKGDIVVFDEAGVGMSSREWYSVQNKLLGSVLQTFRNMNVGVIFTTPNLSFIDVQARKLFHHYFETAFIDYDEDEAFLKVYEIQVNSRLDKIYYKKPKFADENGRVFTMSHLVVDKPKEDIIEYYEGLKSAYTSRLNENALRDLLEPRDKPKKEVDLSNVKVEVLKKSDKYLKEYNKRKFIDVNMLKSDFSLTLPQAKLVKREVETDILKHT
jgi:hypothetical protein